MPKNCWKSGQFTIAVFVDLFAQYTVLSVIGFVFRISCMLHVSLI